MSRHYKEIKNGKGTVLIIKQEPHGAEDSYISVGPGGTDIMLRGAGKVLAFDTWEQMIGTIDTNQTAYASVDS